MKRIRVKTEDDDFAAEDVVRVVIVMAERGYLCTKDQAVHMWQYHSESMCAGWLAMPAGDDDLFETLRHYFEAL